MRKPKNLRFDNERGTSVPYEKASPELIRQLKEIGQAVGQNGELPCCRFYMCYESCREKNECAAINKAISILEGKA